MFSRFLVGGGDEEEEYRMLQKWVVEEITTRTWKNCRLFSDDNNAGNSKKSLLPTFFPFALYKKDI